MKFWAFVVLLHWDAIATTEACRDGEITITGVRSSCLLAGRVSLCVDSEWRAVCLFQWDVSESIVVCKEFGFPAEGARFCSANCLGSDDSINGTNEYQCYGNESKLADCSFTRVDNPCGRSLGIICYNSSSDTCDTEFQPSTNGFDIATTSYFIATTSYPNDDTSYLNDDKECVVSTTDPDPNAAAEASMSIVSVGAVLGGVIVLQALILVVVVLGWVWTCYRRKKISSRKKTSSRTSLPNLSCTVSLPPSSSSSSSPPGSSKYSPQGPRNTNHGQVSGSNSPLQKEIYEVYEMPDGTEYVVVKSTTGDEGEEVYHVRLGDASQGEGTEDNSVSSKPS